MKLPLMILSSHLELVRIMDEFEGLYIIYIHLDALDVVVSILGMTDE